MTKKKEKEKEKVITELIEGNPVFESQGISRVKVTKINDEDEVEVEPLIFPIRSTGVSELIDTFSRKAPKPPVQNQLIKPDSTMGREMKLGRKQWVKMLDFSDPTYLEAKEKHDRDLGMAVMFQGLDVKIRDKEGKEVTDNDQCVEILKGLKMTSDHFMQIVNDIQDLTKWKEDQQADFFD